MSDSRTLIYPVSNTDIGDLELNYVLSAVRSGWVSSIGEFVDKFEKRFADLCGAKHGVSLSNGTAALFITLKAMDIQPGDEVIVPALTFAAVPAVVRQVGATPVIVDVHPDYWAMDPKCLEAAINERTRAIMVVHTYGHPADMDRIMEVADAHGLRVIEDCAEAHCARYKGRVVGGLADVGCFSFYGNKIITTGEGGMIVTNHGELADRVRHLKDHAMDKQRRYWHEEVGYNLRLTNIQAALGCAQLERIDEIMEKRDTILQWYRQELTDNPALHLNPQMSWAAPVNWMVCVVWKGADELQRNTLLNALRNHGVDTRPFFIPVSQLPPYRTCPMFSNVPGKMPVADRLSASGFNLPSYSKLQRQDVFRIASILQDELISKDS
ncbi:MAG TPA: DegT/DnrJ/EryC1/StrS family aminotransferase [Syntrophales bacterium]|nr:DegT/DnrJ/EryC1/StrS family aminotransferase [Syntrophales bacterium]